MSTPAPFDHTDTALPPVFFRRKYDVSRTTFWRYRKAGLPAIEVGAKTFVRDSDFVAFLERLNGQTVPATAAASTQATEGKP